MREADVRHVPSTWLYGRADARTFRLQAHFPRLLRVHRPPPHVREVVEVEPGGRARQRQSLAITVPCAHSVYMCCSAQCLGCPQRTHVTALRVEEAHRLPESWAARMLTYLCQCTFCVTLSSSAKCKCNQQVLCGQVQATYLPSGKVCRSCSLLLPMSDACQTRSRARGSTTTGPLQGGKPLCMLLPLFEWCQLT